jgi:putative component of membrane protein insertase Oxa1/YidC/SpoIIIJ protein YidD
VSRILATAFAVALAVLFDQGAADALEGFRCQHTPQCSAYEVCVADSQASTWGVCRRLKVLP